MLYEKKPEQKRKCAFYAGTLLCFHLGVIYCWGSLRFFGVQSIYACLPLLALPLAMLVLNEERHPAIFKLFALSRFSLKRSTRSFSRTVLIIQKHSKEETVMLYKTKGTCSVGIVELEPDHTIQKVEFIGGCSGNTRHRQPGDRHFQQFFLNHLFSPNKKPPGKPNGKDIKK